MMTLRRSHERGYADHGWLKSFHSFSFADYYDPDHMGWGNLRVINEDRITPGTGFGTHGHRDMEIISYVLEGELAHKDSIGNGAAIRPGEVQRMSAGSGIMHSEYNQAANETTHFLQIWIMSERTRIEPGYRAESWRRLREGGQPRRRPGHHAGPANAAASGIRRRHRGARLACRRARVAQHPCRSSRPC